MQASAFSFIRGIYFHFAFELQSTFIFKIHFTFDFNVVCLNLNIELKLNALNSDQTHA